MPSLPFVKATACGNDFILIEGEHAEPAQMPALTRSICERHLGVGADGVEWLFPDSGAEADVRVRLYNADGSEAEVSGNGTRCVAAWLAHQTGKKELRIRTDAGIKACTLIAHRGMQFEFRTSMGEARVGDPKTFRLWSGEVTGVPVALGNPHFVVTVEEFKPGWQREAMEIGAHSSFQQGANVEFVKVRNPAEIEIRIFERGAGETQSSGTGSCAAAVAAIVAGKARSPVKVVSPGGAQIVEWEREVVLTGPAQILSQGEFFL
ncbi:MAG TPA: diaminopimelate epimerase [Terriglobales bacterium]|nr:diaminopimelate epimerase [Terriglobales bacterium]